MTWRTAWLPQLVLLCGVLLRLFAWAATPYQLANDDHFTPVRIILDQHRLPRAEDCWSCYQPPLYYVLAAALYRGTYEFAGWATDSADRRQAAARKVVQCISTVAGCATLLICLLVLRRAAALTPIEQAIALGFVAFLPRHIHMSAMATNDSLAYCMASLAIWSAIRAWESGWRPARVCICGLLAGAAVLAKAYGLVTAVCVIAVVAAFSVGAQRGLRLRTRLAPVVLTLACALLVGAWPTVLNLANYGKLHVDNFELLPTGLRNQPPGSVAQIEFFSFRLPALLRHPWSHVSHLDSFWTALYARLWFDSAGTQNTLLLSPEWHQHRARIDGRNWPPGEARGLALRDYTDADTPADFRRVAVASYLLGLPLAAAALAGFVLVLRRAPRDFLAALLALHFAGCIVIPLVQTLRLPTISAMKAEFMFNGLTSVPIFAAALFQALPTRYRRVLAVFLAIVLIGLIVCNAAYIQTEHTRSADMIPDIWAS